METKPSGFSKHRPLLSDHNVGVHTLGDVVASMPQTNIVVVDVASAASNDECLRAEAAAGRRLRAARSARDDQDEVSAAAKLHFWIFFEVTFFPVQPMRGG